MAVAGLQALRPVLSRTPRHKNEADEVQNQQSDIGVSPSSYDGQLLMP